MVNTPVIVQSYAQLYIECPLYYGLQLYLNACDYPNKP